MRKRMKLRRLKGERNKRKRSTKRQTITGKKRTLKELLRDMKSQMDYLGHHDFHIKGYGGDDLVQIMSMGIIKTYRKNRKYYSHRKLGWWFIRCRWLLLNLHKKNSKSNPLANSVSIDSLHTW